MNKIRKSKRVKFYLGLAFVIIIIFSLSSIIPSENLRLGQGEIYSLNENWEVIYGDTKIGNSTLPFEVDVPKEQELLANVEIPSFFPDKFKIRLRSSMQNIDVLVDGKEIFKTNKPERDVFDIPEASVWYIVDLPSNIQGKTLSLKLSSSVDTFVGTINPIYAGDGDDLLYKIIYEQKTGIIISAFIFMFGLFALIVSAIIRNFNDNRMLYLGVFAILFSIWIFSETRLLQLVTGNRFIIGGISYIMLSLMPIPFTLYLREGVLIGSKKKLTYIALFLFLVFLLNIALQIFNISKFIESIAYIFVIQVIVVSYLIFLIVVEAIKLKNKEARKFLLYSIVLVSFLIFELYYFYLGNYKYTSMFARIGIFIFLAFILRNNIKQLDELMLKEKETEIMKRLAYTDILTGGNNRAAFKRDLNNLLNSKKDCSFRVIMMDINNLKYVNDKFGHQQGDDMIKLSYKTISEVFDINAKHYRIGGDEFTSILKDTDEDMYRSKVNELNNCLEEVSKRLNYNLSIAIGSDIYSNENFENELTFLDHVDHLMYENKRFLKGN